MDFTVFIPTYNRAHLLPRALRSVEQQTLRDFDVLIVDDGSTDNTFQVAQEWISAGKFPIRYVRQSNRGKHAAYNTALKHVTGEFTVTLDSDDMLTPEALALFKNAWESIPLSQRNAFAGVEGLCASLADGGIVGTKFPCSAAEGGYLDSNYLELYRRFRVDGDKSNAILTRVLREHPFPLFPGETFMPEAVVWKRIALKYKFRYLNQIVQIIEYQRDGLSSNPFILRVNNPHAFRLQFMEEINIYSRLYAEPGQFKRRLRSYDRYVRYSVHAGVAFSKQWRDIKGHGFFLVCFVIGVVHAWTDNMRMRRRGHARAPAPGKS